ncbi:MAG: transposase [Saprospiraceae bacterium]
MIELKQYWSISGTAKRLVLGGHQTTCTTCNNRIYSYNSCGDSNCPQCQNIKKQLWIDKMSHHLLPVKHFHLIFTLPHELNDLIFYNKKRLYGLLFEIAAKTVQKVLGGKIGMVATLHSWGSNLAYHPHLHVIVAAGSWQNGEWKPSNPYNPRCFCNAKALRTSFKELFLKRLLLILEEESLHWGKGTIQNPDIFPKIKQIYHNIQKKKWTVRIENPVLGVEQIIEYLARYVRRVAITNSRIEEVTTDKVIINYKQYALQKKGQPAPIGKRVFEGEKFIQQFSQHFMPRGFHKVRYYGFYGFGAKKLKAAIHQKLIGRPPTNYKKPSKKELIKKMLGQDLDLCTNCGIYNSLETALILATPSLIYSLTKTQSPPSRAGPMPKVSLKAVVF